MHNYRQIKKYKEQFATAGYVHIKGLLDETTISTLTKYYQNKANSGLWTVREPNPQAGDASQLASYSDPLIEVLLENLTTTVEDIVGCKMYPTYSYSRVYMGNDELEPHVDRPSCQYSMTVHVQTYGNEKWPVWMQAPGGYPSSYELEPGDAVLYKGCEIEHWREPMGKFDIQSNLQFMLHYVDKNGPFSDYKYDKRPGLGYSDSART